MKSSFLKKYTLWCFLLLLGVLLAFACFPSHAFAWTKEYSSNIRTYSINPTFKNLNKGMVNSYGNYLANCRSEMTAYCSSGAAPAGSMKVQGVITYGTILGEEYSEFGLMVSNANSMAQNAQLTGIKEFEISNLKGHVGALAWGQGSVRSNSGVWRDLDTEYHLVATLDANGNIVPASVDPGESLLSCWQPGQNNFIGANGLTYGVPAISSSGEITQPDMLRVLLDGGIEAYVSSAEMQEITSNAVAQLDYDQEASSFASLISEELKTNVISRDQAKELISDFKCVGSLNEKTAESFISLNDSNNEVRENISEYVENALLQVAKSQSVAIPAYSVNGDLLGYYDIDIL